MIPLINQTSIESFIHYLSNNSSA